MQSNFLPKPRAIKASTGSLFDETYDLRGLNLYLPDQVMPKGQTPFAINARMYAKNSGDSSVAIRTRHGTAKFTEITINTASSQNLGTGIADMSFTTAKALAMPFRSSVDGVLAHMDFEVKKDSTSQGHIIVGIYTNASGFPGELVAASSILAADVTSSFTFIRTYFIDAPDIDSTLSYWAVLYIQDNGAGSYYVNQTSDGT